MNIPIYFNIKDDYSEIGSFDSVIKKSAQHGLYDNVFKKSVPTLAIMSSITTSVQTICPSELNTLDAWTSSDDLCTNENPSNSQRLFN